MNSSLVFFSGLIFAACLSSCKDGANPDIPVEPVIEIRDVYPSTVIALSDSIVFELAYTDGDGDLGFMEADSAVVYITDERFPITETFHVPPLAPEGDPIAITGVLNVVLQRTILENPAATSESVIFSLRIRDRAGHWSNTVQSKALTVILG